MKLSLDTQQVSGVILIQSNGQFKFKPKILMKTIIVFTALLICASAQETLQQAFYPLNTRPFGDLKQEKSEVPREYICGAGVWRKAMVGPLKQVCYRTNFGMKCQPTTYGNLWTRVNGIKFAYCDSANWGNKVQREDIGSQTWEGMKYCPQNHLVSGFKTKLTERDGLAGLIINCRAIAQRSTTTEILVFDGEGSWGNLQISSNFAMGFRTQRNVNYITGLSLNMMALPQINEIKISYAIIDKFDVTTNFTQNETFTNYMFDPVSRNFSFSSDSALSYGWYNSNGNWHEGNFKRRLSAGLLQKGLITVPSISNDLKQIVSRNVSIKDITFGTQMSETLHLANSSEILVPHCMKAYLFGTQYLSEVEIPFEMRISEAIGGKAQWRVVSGKFKGLISSGIRITSRFIDINC